MSPSHLFWWRRLAREGRLQADDETAEFARAVVACEASEPVTAPGRIEIVLASGVRVIVDRNVDVDALIRIISAVERR
jgi:transposase